MSDLISRNKLIDYFYFGIDDKPIIDGISDRKIIDIIKNQPTAYDIDKVVEELELHSFEFGTDTLPAHYVRLNEATEIVKQGGVSNDVCEWKDTELYGYYTSCTEFKSRIACKDTYWKYCPYCGKKIKVVE